jgi:hypothetical protein
MKMPNVPKVPKMPKVIVSLRSVISMNERCLTYGKSSK